MLRPIQSQNNNLLLEFLHNALVQVVAEILHRATAILENNRSSVVWQLPLRLCVAADQVCVCVCTYVRVRVSE